MSYLSIDFLIFICLFVCIYYLIPCKYRYICILLGSLFFYGYKSPELLLLLLLTIAITYTGGLVLSAHPKKSLLSIFLILNFSVLIVFKYSDFILTTIRRFGILGSSEESGLDSLGLILPVGLSFYIFQSTTYLIDVYRRKIQPERNILLYAAFVSFFPTILSGPIQKAKELLPQIKAPKAFDNTNAQKGLILFIWGWLEKVLVVNNLHAIIDSAYSDIENSKGGSLLVAIACYSLYIYADFSSYSDISRGIAKILGIEVGRNFNNPYLSKSLSEFWTRWHTSLNNWFVDYLYIPLGGSRKGLIRKYINVMIVFLVSGIWHGSQWHFVAWGIANGLLVIIGSILAPYKKKLYQAVNVDEQLESIVFIKRAGVFAFISFTWLLFDRGFSDVILILNKVRNMHFFDLIDENILMLAGTTTALVCTIVYVTLFCIIQCKRAKEAFWFEKFNKQPIFLQCILLAIVVTICFLASFESSSVTNSEFLYFKF